MKDNRCMMIKYQRYTATNSSSFLLEPYSIKLFRQRWYLIGKLSNGFLSTFSLDRIKEIKLLEKKFKMPDDFDAADFFHDSYGVMVDKQLGTERIILRAYNYESYYLRDLPLHHSQREICRTDDYADFELKLKPTSDFKSKLLSRGDNLEVLEPKSLADEIIEWHQKAIERYKKK